MADMVSIGHVADTGPGSKLKTGAIRRSYGMGKKKRKLPKYKSSNNKYVEGR